MTILTLEDILPYLNGVINLLPGSIYVKDVHGVYLGCNEFQARMGGFKSLREVIGKTDYDLPWKDAADVIRAFDKQIMETGIAQGREERAKIFDDTEMVMQSLKSPLYNNEGEIIGIIGVSLDITARKRAEEREREALRELSVLEARKQAEEEAKRAIMVLAGSIVHDLRTPLMCLRSSNYVLEKTLPILLKCYRPIQEAGIDIGHHLSFQERDWIENHVSDLPKNNEKFMSQMETFIDDNLKAIKVSTSNVLTTEELVECKSYKSIRDALNVYPFGEGERQLVEWDESHYFNFLGNPLLFMRIIFNLLSNALYQIRKNNKGKIYISSKENEDSHIICFKDTAGGAHPDIINHIFDGYLTTKEKGAGVGLSFCKMTMKNFGGDISCVSVEGNYIEFLLTFPKIK